MEITITRTGGFAGLRRQWVVAVDEQTADRLVRQMGDGDAAVDGPPAERDRFTYVFAAGVHRIAIAESRLDGPWRDLLEEARNGADPTRPA
ncbi:hypothetical protein GCM10011512_03810 [Tersicoccus solisilvae]|uniref:Uncharacterized protein n=1 Tax=Tersicoccus solisilvae TaxID=1882339 RepID=A0ABQ1NP89_9MICC|nr:protealysin inhibitor emfourin [Tersicoccus solisilvae]GGC80323.1 hypothetical protein GCM10011512_03810 [Tersicoccus solisilvae]